MKIKLYTSVILLAFSSAAAQANEWQSSDTYQNDTYAANTAVAEDVNYNERVRCWGWDGSQGGTDMRMMTRGECLNMHGTVQNRPLKLRPKTSER